MALVPRKVFGVIQSAIGGFFADKKVKFKPVQVFGASGLTIPALTIEAAINNTDGSFEADLLTFDDDTTAPYECQLPDGDSFSFNLQQGADIELETLRVLNLVVIPPDVPTLETIISALLVAMAVRFDIAQTLDAAQKLQARSNIGVTYAVLTDKPVYDIRDFGALVDGVTDDTSAIEAAIQAVKVSGGGTVYFPKGITYFATGGINIDFADFECSLSFKGTQGSIIKVRGAATNKILISGANYVEVSGLMFLGTDALNYAYTMDSWLFRFLNVEKVLVENNIFAGIRCAATDGQQGGVVNCENCNLVAKNNYFGACGTVNTSNLRNLNWKSIYSENNIFKDFITLFDVYYEIVEPAVSWISAINAEPTFSTQLFSSKNDTFDEGAGGACYINNGGSLIIDGALFNQGTAQPISCESGVKLIKASNIKVQTNLDSGLNRSWLYADGAQMVDLFNVVCLNNSRHIYLTGTTAKLKIRKSSLNAEATYPTGIRNLNDCLIDWDDKTITNVANANYTAVITDSTIIYTSLSASGKTVTLPTAVGIKGKEFLIIDGAGAAASFNLTIDGNGAETINGAATAVINANFGKVRVKSNGVNWFIV